LTLGRIVVSFFNKPYKNSIHYIPGLSKKFPKLDTLRLTRGKIRPYNGIAGWRGILLSPASFSFETLAPRQPAFSSPPGQAGFGRRFLKDRTTAAGLNSVSAPRSAPFQGGRYFFSGSFFSGSFFSTFSAGFRSLARSLRWSLSLRWETPSVYQAGAGLPMRWWSKNSFIRTV